MSKDFLADCLQSMNTEGTTVEDFKTAFCSTCINPDCNRSRWSDSKWLNRMISQEEILRNPIFGDPKDPRYRPLQKPFEPVEPETLKFYGGWVEVRDDGSVVNHAPAPQKMESASKVDLAVKALKPPELSTQEQPPPEPVNPPEPVKGSVVPEPEPASERRPTAAAANTPTQKGGIRLGAPDQQHPPSPKPSVLMANGDPWATQTASPSKRGRDGKLKVRVDTGEVIHDK